MTKSFRFSTGLETEGDLGGVHQVLREDGPAELRGHAAAAAEQTFRISFDGFEIERSAARTRSGNYDRAGSYSGKRHGRVLLANGVVPVKLVFL